MRTLKPSLKILALFFLISVPAYANCDMCAWPYPDLGSCSANCNTVWPGATCHSCYDAFYNGGQSIQCCYDDGGAAPELPPGVLPMLMLATLFAIFKLRRYLSPGGSNRTS